MLRIVWKRIHDFWCSRCIGCAAVAVEAFCADCAEQSAISAEPWLSRLGSRQLLFVGRYHRDPDGGARPLSPLGLAICAFKGGDRHAGRRLSALFAARLREKLRGVDVVLPVPSNLARLQQRGFSPAARLARELARAGAARLELRLLARERGRPPQRGLGGEARRRNAQGAFLLQADAARDAVRGRRVAVVDDVLTTGATLRDAASRVLEAGAGDVLLLALACADEELIARCRSRIASAGKDVTRKPRA